MNYSLETKLTYSIPELAKSLGIGLNKAYELASSKNFPAIRIGKKIIVPKEALVQWLSSQKNV